MIQVLFRLYHDEEDEFFIQLESSPMSIRITTATMINMLWEGGADS